MDAELLDATSARRSSNFPLTWTGIATCFPAATSDADAADDDKVKGVADELADAAIAAAGTSRIRLITCASTSDEEITLILTVLLGERAALALGWSHGEQRVMYRTGHTFRAILLTFLDTRWSLNCCNAMRMAAIQYVSNSGIALATTTKREGEAMKH